VKSKKLYFGFVDLEKAFDRVPTSPTHLSNHGKLANSGTINSSYSRVCGYLGVAVEGVQSLVIAFYQNALNPCLDG